ncbi:TPA: DUF262 domain-containing protein [Pasteurella multocida]|nr:DUF262 domain-containing protein [Pasteurella multocida]
MANTDIQEINLVSDDCDDEISLYPSETFKLTTTPNDFNISTIISFLDAGVFKIPDFQRNYVWDINKASKLIESLLIGLPIPQMFLYEKSRNEFFVIDGQQRLMSLYFFVKGKFPKTDARLKIRESAKTGEFISKSLLSNNKLFSNFSLKLDSKNNPQKNRFHDKNYETLEFEDKTTLDLATIRNMIIKPSTDSEDNVQSMFEIFNRLNSGGVNLNNQEIRMSLYHSKFLKELIEMNKNTIWRENLLSKSQEDLRLKDIELILRLFGMLLAGYNSALDKNKNEKIEYQNSMIGFLNNIANSAKNLKDEEISLLKEIWDKFMIECKCSEITGPLISFSTENPKLSITFLESVFFGCCRKAWDEKNINLIQINRRFIEESKEDQNFKDASTGKTSSKTNVIKRLKIAYNKYNFKN